MDAEPAEPGSAVQTYGIARWGGGYFEIGANGHLLARPRPSEPVTVDLYQVAHEARAAGLSWPVLVRFTDILRDRVAALRGAFARACAELDYPAPYTAVYPIKVNQQRSVVEQILAGGEGGGGLEAGSKPELMAVLALSRPGGVVVCNGYKDREYVRLALIGRAVGHRVYIVVEKPSELDLVLAESAALGIEPLLGVRIRLASSAAGKWQNSGGEKAKFGLSAAQVLGLVERLREAGRLDWTVCGCFTRTSVRRSRTCATSGAASARSRASSRSCAGWAPRSMWSTSAAGSASTTRAPAAATTARSTTRSTATPARW